MKITRASQLMAGLAMITAGAIAAVAAPTTQSASATRAQALGPHAPCRGVDCPPEPPVPCPKSKLGGPFGICPR